MWEALGHDITKINKNRAPSHMHPLPIMLLSSRHLSHPCCQLLESCSGCAQAEHFPIELSCSLAQGDMRQSAHWGLEVQQASSPAWAHKGALLNGSSAIFATRKSGRPAPTSQFTGLPAHGPQPANLFAPCSLTNSARPFACAGGWLSWSGNTA